MSMNSEERVDKLYTQLPQGSAANDIWLDMLVEFAILEYCIYREMYESLMDQKTGMSFFQYIT